MGRKKKNSLLSTKNEEISKVDIKTKHNKKKGLSVSGNDATENVNIEFDIKRSGTYDESNQLVLLPKKKKEKKIVEHEKTTKKLSDKQRKKLQKILERKKKKLNRAELFEKLAAVQSNAEDLDKLISTSNAQTFGIKRLTDNSHPASKRRKLNNLKGTKNETSDEEQSDDDNNISRTFPDSKSQKINNLKGAKKDSSEEELSDTNSDSSDEDVLVKNKVKCSKAEKDLSFASKDKQKNVIGINNDCSKKKNVDSESVSKNIFANKESTDIFQSSTIFVPVKRTPEIQAAREALPIFSEEQPIIEAIKEHPVVLIHGETGSGKTTQIPQFLYEAGFTQNDMMIGICEPRRIAAMTMAARVGQEMGMPNAVSYKIRYEKSVNSETKIKFMTEGILLREMQKDRCLSKYSVIILDEAHERSVFCDVLIGLLSRVLYRDKLKKKKYPPLKLIIMSATMCVEEFMNNRKLFRITPFLFKVNSRQYTVQAHFSKHTPEDYVEAAYHKVCKIHKTLPAGAILVFLTGENEIKQLCKLLRETFPLNNLTDQTEADPENTTKEKKKGHKIEHSFIPDIDLDDFGLEPSINYKTDDIKVQSDLPLCALPLYSILPLAEQEKVFKPPPANSRLCVVATNVAETSITIPGLKYVVDSGKVKTRAYSTTGGASKFIITWCSKASANQRAGRAGRTEGGHCYRLYSSAIFDNEFPDFTPPEIQRIPADDVVLQMKALEHPLIPKVIDFPFPSPPDIEAFKAAERRLVLLGALKDEVNSTGEFSGDITNVGKIMAQLPLSPRFSLMVVIAKLTGCVPYAIAIACAMTVSEVFQRTVVEIDDEENIEGEEVKTKVVSEGVKRMGTGRHLKLGDAMVLLRTVARYEECKNKTKFCIKNGIRRKAMEEVHKMGIQLINEVNKIFADSTKEYISLFGKHVPIPVTLNLEYPSDDTVRNLGHIFTKAFVDHIARRVPTEKWKKDRNLKNAYQCTELEEYVFIHPSSILFKELPEYIVYYEIIHTSKFYMKGIVAIEEEWIPNLVPKICEFSEPKEKPEPYYNSADDTIHATMDVKIGRWAWEMEATDVMVPKGLLKYRLFCSLFLDGKIYKEMEKYSKHLHPTIVLREWAFRFKPDVISLLDAFIAKGIHTKKLLEEVWEKDKLYLLNEVLKLLPKKFHAEFQRSWPPRS